MYLANAVLHGAPRVEELALGQQLTLQASVLGDFVDADEWGLANEVQGAVKDLATGPAHTHVYTHNSILSLSFSFSRFSFVCLLSSNMNRVQGSEIVIVVFESN